MNARLCAILAAIFVIGIAVYAVRSFNACVKHASSGVSIYKEDLYMDAKAKAESLANECGGFVGHTSGTPSMVPLIVGKVFTVSVRQPFSSLKMGQVIVYIGEDGGWWLHQIVAKDRGGLLLSGLNNDRTESYRRVTEKEYRGALVAIVTYPNDG